jgi:hypothetical protein
MPTEPSTWEEGAAESLAGIARLGGSPIKRRGDLRPHLETLIRLNELRDVPLLIDWHAEFQQFGVTAATAMDHLEIPSIASMVEMLARKQHDYGPENILRFGNTGLLVRLHDKVARLENLARRASSDALNESIFDTHLDILGYSVIGMMLAKGWFTLPLHGDKIKTTEQEG